MHKWGIIVSTYGNSEVRLRRALSSLQSTAMPYDLYVRGAVLTYQQELKHYEVCRSFGAQYLESAKWRNYDVARCVRRVQNEMIAFVKDDLFFPHNWLEVMDFFWTRNENVGSVGWAMIEAWELVSAGLWRSEDQFWEITELPKVQRQDLKTTLMDRNYSNCDAPIFTDATSPPCWTFRRNDFERMDGFYWVGPGDQSCMYADLYWPRGMLCVNLPYPAVLHRKEASTRDYCFERGIAGLGQDRSIWGSPETLEEYRQRWGVKFQDKRRDTCERYCYPLMNAGANRSLNWIRT